MAEIQCPHCGYEWEYKGELIKTTCPSCQLKVPTGKGEETEA